jgi:hypothetical protein
MFSFWLNAFPVDLERVQSLLYYAWTFQAKTVYLIRDEQHGEYKNPRIKVIYFISLSYQLSAYFEVWASSS